MTVIAVAITVGGWIGKNQTLGLIMADVFVGGVGSATFMLNVGPESTLPVKLSSNEKALLGGVIGYCFACLIAVAATQRHRPVAMAVVVLAGFMVGAGYALFLQLRSGRAPGASLP